MSSETRVVEVTPELIKAARIAFRTSLDSVSYGALRSAIEAGQSSVEIVYKGEKKEMQTGNLKPMISADQAIEDELKNIIAKRGK